MPTLEDLSVDQLLSLARQTQASHTLLTQLTNNPQTRGGLQKLIKTVAPNTPIPELDAKEEVLREFSTLKEGFEQMRMELIERDVRTRVAEQRSQLKSKFGFTDEEVAAVEKIMVDEQIPSHSTAAVVFNASRKSAEPTPAVYMPPTYDMPEKDVWAKGIGNKSMLNKIGIQQAFDTWNQIMSGKIAGLGPNRAGFGAQLSPA